MVQLQMTYVTTTEEAFSSMRFVFVHETDTRTNKREHEKVRQTNYMY